MFEQTFKNIDDVLWKEAGCSTELDYTEQTSWLLFLKYLDDLEVNRAMEAELVGKGLTRGIEDAGQPVVLDWLQVGIDDADRLEVEALLVLLGQGDGGQRQGQGQAEQRDSGAVASHRLD